MGKNFNGLVGFAEGWGQVAKKCISRKPKWDFSKAPKGPRARIVLIETGEMFITYAKRALASNGLFERSSITIPYLAATLEPHGMTVADLSPAEREKGIKRTNKAISADLNTFVFFGLFEKTETMHAYRLTKLGEHYYVWLENDGIDLPDSADGNGDNCTGDNSVNGRSVGDHPEIIEAPSTTPALDGGDTAGEIAPEGDPVT